MLFCAPSSLANHLLKSIDLHTIAIPSFLLLLLFCANLFILVVVFFVVYTRFSSPSPFVFPPHRFHFHTMAVAGQIIVVGMTRVLVVVVVVVLVVVAEEDLVVVVGMENVRNRVDMAWELLQLPVP